jgi:hypothetical protein
LFSAPQPPSRSPGDGALILRTTKSTVIFRHPFTLDKSAGELPAGEYEIEVDEEEIGPAADRMAYRRVATFFYVTVGASWRTILLDSKALEAALERDANVAR